LYGNKKQVLNSDNLSKEKRKYIDVIIKKRYHNDDMKIQYWFFLLFRVVEIQRIYETTATPRWEGASL